MYNCGNKELGNGGEWEAIGYRLQFIWGDEKVLHIEVMVVQLCECP